MLPGFLYIDSCRNARDGIMCCKVVFTPKITACKMEHNPPEKLPGGDRPVIVANREAQMAKCIAATQQINQQNTRLRTTDKEIKNIINKEV